LIHDSAGRYAWSRSWRSDQWRVPFAGFRDFSDEVIDGGSVSGAAWHNWLTRHGKTAREWLDESRRTFEAASTEGLERLRAVIADYDGTDPEEISNEDFEYGLERVLDGLQARLGRSS
jgi:hypothetical protein